MAKEKITTKPSVVLGRRRRHMAQIATNGGYYITNCQPWNIPEGCNRLDCPMRSAAIAPEAKPDDYLLECDPPGDLATMLMLLAHTTPTP